MSARKVLLVEDNPDDEALAVRALSRTCKPVRIQVARDGPAALAHVRGMAREALPDVVLLDLKLPGMNGIEVLRHLRSDPHTSSVPVVVLTSSAEDRDIVESYRAGANGYVRKPVDFDAFTRTVHDLGHFWLDLNESPRRRMDLA